MSLRGDFDGFAKEARDYQAESRVFQGKALEFMRNMDSHIVAVSKKADTIRESLDKHKDAQDAHGLGRSGKDIAAVLAWLSLAVAVGGLALKVYAH